MVKDMTFDNGISLKMFEEWWLKVQKFWCVMIKKPTNKIKQKKKEIEFLSKGINPPAGVLAEICEDQIKLSREWTIIHKKDVPKLNAERYCKLIDLPSELLYKIADYGVSKTTMMYLNSKFLDVFAPEVYSNVHAICCLRTNKFSGSEEFETFKKGKNKRQLEKYWALRGDRIEVVESYPIHTDALGDYRHRRTTLITNFDTLVFFFSHILNGKSRLKKYVKNFTMDFAFIDTIGTDLLYTRLIDHELRRWSINSEIIKLSKPSNFITYDFKYMLSRKMEHLMFKSEKRCYKALIELCHGYGNIVNDRRTRHMMILTQLYDNYFSGKRFALYECSELEAVQRFDPFQNIGIDHVNQKDLLDLYHEYSDKCEEKVNSMEFPVCYTPEMEMMKKTIRMMISTFIELPSYTKGQLLLLDIATTKNLENADIFQVHKPVCKVVNINI